ncbi:hypothetical protein K5K93_07790 [Stenotrophomonas sp. DR822]|uniref:PIN domain-containing protein n=1 Tax=unclassified Stenotrophomonas TaxID=196198 RepID=UPI001C98DAF4|nr:PIN domain-containing protein [Stenotrophomonas sp. DR822]QZN82302.1 hypothetical protein K5K93_07790 [Stenotrophomonas sp. DR822]
MDMPLARNVVLIDFENVQPPSLKELAAPGFTVLVFVGASQARISMDVAEAMQALGSQGRYIRCHGSGPNALDFHIAFYIGEMAASDPKVFFHIISKDTGFDPLVAHLRSRGLQAGRCTSVADLPMFRSARQKAAAAASPATKTMPPDTRLVHLRDWLVRQDKARPGSKAALHNSINNLFQKALPAGEVNALVQQLQQKKWIVLEGNKVCYQVAAMRA